MENHQQKENQFHINDNIQHNNKISLKKINNDKTNQLKRNNSRCRSIQKMKHSFKRLSVTPSKSKTDQSYQNRTQRKTKGLFKPYPYNHDQKKIDDTPIVKSKHKMIKEKSHRPHQPQLTLYNHYNHRKQYNSSSISTLDSLISTSTSSLESLSDTESLNLLPYQDFQI